MQKTLAFLVTFLLWTQTKRNVLLSWTMTPMKHHISCWLFMGYKYCIYIQKKNTFIHIAALAQVVRVLRGYQASTFHCEMGLKQHQPFFPTYFSSSFCKNKAFKVNIYLQMDNFFQIWIFGSKYQLKCDL